MKYNNIFVLFTLALFLFRAPVFSQAQLSSEIQEDQPLKTQFQKMLDKSETYAEYKVIKSTDLSTYSQSVQDSLHANSSEINKLKNAVNDQKSKLSQLSIRITELENHLATSEKLRESLSIFGLKIYKTTYQWIVWSIIIALTVFGIFAYISFIRSNIITSKTNKDYKDLETDFEDHKKKNYEKQLKLGRELQTERNKVEDLKSSLKGKTTGKS
jgi:chromosome segregation ATPase